MAKYEETVFRDDNRDGTFDHKTVTWNIFNDAGRLDYTVKDTDLGNDGVLDQREEESFTYDAAGRLTGGVYLFDNPADGLVEYTSTSTLQYNEAGQLIVDRDDSEDYDGDGNPDYSNVNLYQYNTAGQTASVETIHLFNYEPNQLDYRIESFTYNAQGLVAEHYIDDWALYDFTIGYRNTYNTAGQITKVQTQNEFEFGDTAWHTEETYKYSGGRLIEHNDYGEWFNGTYVLEVKNKLYYNSAGQVSKEVTTGQNHSWQTVEKMQTEHWYSDGQETTRLTSFDDNLDGVWDASTRTLERWTYHDDGAVASYVLDTTTGDGIIEESMTNLLVA